MADYFILTKQEAEALRGQTSRFTAIDPQELKDGTFILPVAVLTDPAHAKFFSDRKRDVAIDVHAKQPRVIETTELKSHEPEPPIDPDTKPGAKE